MTIKHAFTNPKADGGDSTIVRPSDWNADHVVNGELALEILSATPSAPASTNINIFGREIAGRGLAAFQGPSGLDSVLQPMLGRNKVSYYVPNGNSTGATSMGLSMSTVGGAARNVATTNYFTRLRRIGLVSAATAGAIASLRNTAAQITLGNGSGLGGFFTIYRFGISDATLVSTARMFVGVQNVTSAPTNVSPATLTNCIGVGHDTGDTKLRLYYGGSTAQTPLTLGDLFDVERQKTIELALFSPSSVQEKIYYQVTELETGVSFSGEITKSGNNLPSATTLLSSTRIFRTNGTAGTLAVGLDVVSVYLETDQ